MDGGKQNREKQIVKTSIVGIVGNVVLVVFKAMIGIISHSISIVTDAINNLTDALSSIITIIGTKISNKRPDRKHPYGYGRIEYLTSIIIALLVLFAGCTAIKESVEQLIDMYSKGAEGPAYEMWSLIVIAAAIVVKIGLGIYFRIMGKKTDSDALKGSGTDALTDAILSVSTLVGALVSYFTHVSIEPYLGIAIGLFILKSGIGILRDGVSSIIGERSDYETVQKVKKIALSFPEVRGAYDIVLNNYGPERSIGSVHVEVPDNMTAQEIHHLSYDIQLKVYNELGIIITVGIYASNTSSKKASEVHKLIMSEAKNIPGVVQIHGFYMDEEKKYISFDIICDFKTDAKGPGNQIVEKIKEKYPDYTVYYNIDPDVSASHETEKKKKDEKK